MVAWAAGILRARAPSMKKVNSAVVTVLPAGVFITTTPRWVAAETSTLSTPTPARPTTRSFGAASSTARVTFVSERTTRASTSASKGSNSASDSRLDRTVTLNSGRAWKYAMPRGEMGSQTRTCIKRSDGMNRARGGQRTVGVL